MKTPVLPTAAEEKKQRARDYVALLTVDGKVLPDPMDMPERWIGESEVTSINHRHFFLFQLMLL